VRPFFQVEVPTRVWRSANEAVAWVDFQPLHRIRHRYVVTARQHVVALFKWRSIVAAIYYSSTGTFTAAWLLLWPITRQAARS
jgi:hypothetical protein